MKGALDVHTALLERGVPHEMVRLESRIAGADDLPRVLGLPSGCLVVRCYAVESKSGPGLVAVLLPAGRVPAPAALLDALDARSVRLAGTEQVNTVTDYAAGLVSPVALPSTVELLADDAVQDSDVSYCAVGESGVVLGIRTADLLSATGARVVRLREPAVDQPVPTATVLRLDRPAEVRSAG